MDSRSTVVVAMSGGVDSSVAAALLVQQGYSVIGMMLRLWSEPGADSQNRCCTPASMALARRVASQLDIPFYVIDAREKFHASVVQTFLDGYLAGITPNPCLACNRQIRWGLLLDHAMAIGADYLATGHYARIVRDADGSLRLLRSIDREKDQSYILSILNPAQLSRSIFPIGGYTKSEVRELARNLDLPVADRVDSQDLCFLAGEDYRAFLQRHAPQAVNPGPILSIQGAHIGEHRGLAFYTLGQRKGLGISAPQPLYVYGKDIERNALIVGRAEELGNRSLKAYRINWIRGAPPEGPLDVEVKIRYTALAAPGTLTPIANDRAQVDFKSPQRDVTPGQAAVFYRGDDCLGGGLIAGDETVLR